MTTFDDRFADRVREVFGAYEEPVDDRALAAMRAALGAAAGPAPDRPAAPPPEAARWARRGLTALAVLVIAGALWGVLSPPAPPTGVDAAGTPPPNAVAQADSAAPPALSDAPAAPASGAPPEAGAPPTAPPAGAASPVAAAPRPVATTRPDVPTPEAVRPAAVPPALPRSTPPRSAPMELVAAAPPAALRPEAPRPDARPAVRAGGGAPVSVRLRGTAPAASEGVRLVVATGALAARGGLGDGGGVAAGLAREWPLARGVSLGGGAVLAYNRTTTEPTGPSPTSLYSGLADAPGTDVDVPSESVVTTVAVEVPVDLAVDVVRTRRGRLRASVGLTSAIYVGQTFEDEGRRYSGDYVVDTEGSEAGGPAFVVTSEPYVAEEAVGPGAVDLARQLNLGLGVVGAGPRAAGLDVYARLPLGGLTARDLPLTAVGVRLRLPLP